MNNGVLEAAKVSNKIGMIVLSADFDQLNNKVMFKGRVRLYLPPNNELEARYKNHFSSWLKEVTLA